MAPKATASYGLWPSPIMPRDLTQGARRFGHLQGDGDWLYWSEGRPEERGRQVICRARPTGGGSQEDVLPSPFSARSRVHEYGGGEFLVADAVVYFVNVDDQNVWRVVPGQTPERITNAPDLRFADMALDAGRNRLIAVAERHSASDPADHPENLIVAVSLDPETHGEVTELATGRDFYGFPRMSPDGRRMAFIAWDLPDMPWDQASLYLASIGGDGLAARPQRIAGGNGVAIMQPQWLDDARLIFITDETGFGNLCLWDNGQIRPLTKLKSELGLPMWNLGNRTAVVTGPDRIVASADLDGHPTLVVVSALDQPKPSISMRPVAGASAIGALAACNGAVGAMIGRAKSPAAFAALAERRSTPAILRTASDLTLDPAGISVGKTVSFGGGDRKTTFAQLYLPENAGFRGVRGVLPPALVLAHGGPTSQAARGLALRVQYFTSRGFVVLDVDYAGSTGYGRAYRQRLDGQWGVADVADCVAAAKFLASDGLADASRMAIAGGSAGGYTVLMALATTKVFAAGSSHYGISDLSLLMEHTHKFEAGYLHRLLGTTPKSWKKICAARSPIALVDQISAPLVLFQGLDDKVVPPEQSRLIHERLQAKGVTTALHEFPGEAHGFRQGTTIEKVADAELEFLIDALKLRASST